MRFRLAEALRCSEGFIRSNLSAYELLQWELLEKIQPWGQRRDDYRVAVICWVIASVNYGGKGRRPQLKDFLRLFEFKPKHKQSEDQMAAIFKKMADKK